MGPEGYAVISRKNIDIEDLYFRIGGFDQAQINDLNLEEVK